MKFERKKIAVALAYALGAGSTLLIAAPSQAADISVSVTGSNIRRTESETSAPIQTLSREDIQGTGLQTISEVVRQITANNNGSISDSFTNGFSAGASGVSLRGLGPNNTLVLLNGRRMTTYGLADDGHASYVDLQQIPMDAVDRIEILKDGASAIYGSDAVAGVVNIILRQEFTGVAVSGSGGLNYKGDGKNFQGALTMGTGDLTKDRYNAFVSIGYQQQDAFASNTRPSYIGSNNFAGLGFRGLPDARPGQPSLGYGNGSLSGVIRRVNPATGAPTGVNIPLQPLNCAVEDQVNGFCRYDIKDYVDLVPEVKRFNVYARGSYNFTATTQGYAELSYFQTKTHTRTTPTSLRAAWYNASQNVINSSNNFPLPVGHPDNPLNEPVIPYYTSADINGRDGDYVSQNQRYLLGVKGSNTGWDWDVGGLWMKSDTDITRHGFIQWDRLKQALNGQGGFGYYRLGADASLNNPAIYPWLSPDLSWTASTKNWLIDAKATRELMKLEGGSMGIAVGAEYQNQKLDNPGTPGTFEGNIVGLGSSQGFGDRNIWATYAELYAPVLKNLELTAALRYDHYSDVGGTWNPKVGAKWKVIPEAVLRGTYATGFRAPGLYETSTANAAAGFVTASDPVRCPVTGNGADCNATVLSVNIGNPFIKPETSKSWTIGTILEPLPGLSGTFDYWNIKVDDQITIGSVQAVLNNPSQFPAATIGRDTNNLPGIPNSGTILYTSTPYQNANTVKTDGFDVDVRYRWNLQQYGTFTPEIQWTRVLNYKQTLGGETYNYVGTQGNYDVSSGSATPKDRINIILPWDFGAWNLTGTVRYISDYESTTWQGAKETDGCLSQFDAADCHVSSFTTLDLAGRYTGFKDWEIWGSVINVFNRRAPFNPAAAYGNINYNYNYASSGATGTVFNLGFKYTFK